MSSADIPVISKPEEESSDFDVVDVAGKEAAAGGRKKAPEQVPTRKEKIGETLAMIREVRGRQDEAWKRVEDALRKGDETMERLGEARLRIADLEKRLAKSADEASRLRQTAGEVESLKSKLQGALLSSEMQEKKLNELRTFADNASRERDNLLIEVERLVNEISNKDAEIRKAAEGRREAEKRITAIKAALGEAGK